MNSVQKGKESIFVSMEEDKYNCIKDAANNTFTFESQGPKGVIKKIVKYRLSDKLEDGTPVLNLSFGDLEENLKSINDNAISNNSDRNKVLVTVAHTVLDILEDFGNVAVVARGRTPACTRLYQMGINAHKEEIDKLLEVRGFRESKWEKIEKGINYSAFIAKKKN